MPSRAENLRVALPLRTLTASERLASTRKYCKNNFDGPRESSRLTLVVLTSYLEWFHCIATVHVVSWKSFGKYFFSRFVTRF